ncbi:hypothetical protein GF386_04400 [Candidatus Pacearchaeota archaeon]|nr:hypothetical protein [Candidatus Pacearchaeota archaeon]MBD3283365.1 hypothetical protein [Candidatus Pacearchaeota archaeon]
MKVMHGFWDGVSSGGCGSVSDDDWQTTPLGMIYAPSVFYVGCRKACIC